MQVPGSFKALAEGGVRGLKPKVSQLLFVCETTVKKGWQCVKWSKKRMNTVLTAHYPLVSVISQWCAPSVCLAAVRVKNQRHVFGVSMLTHNSLRSRSTDGAWIQYNHSPQKSLSQPDSSSGGSSVSGGKKSKWLWSIGPFSCRNKESNHQTMALSQHGIICNLLSGRAWSPKWPVQ